jgi:hypothetical protein
MSVCERVPCNAALYSLHLHMLSPRSAPPTGNHHSNCQAMSLTAATTCQQVPIMSAVCRLQLSHAEDIRSQIIHNHRRCNRM